MPSRTGVKGDNEVLLILETIDVTMKGEDMLDWVDIATDEGALVMPSRSSTLALNRLLPGLIPLDSTNSLYFAQTDSILLVMEKPC